MMVKHKQYLEIWCNNILTLIVNAIHRHGSKFQNLHFNFVKKQVVKNCSRVAQCKRAGLITQRSMDRNHALLSFVRSFIIKNFLQHCILETKWVIFNLLGIPKQGNC